MNLDPMPPNDDKVYPHIITYIISWCHVFVNPFIYVYFNKLFKTAMLKTFGCNKLVKKDEFYCLMTIPKKDLHTKFQNDFYE